MTHVQSEWPRRMLQAGTGPGDLERLSGHSKAIIDRGSKSFAHASRLMPAALRPSVHMLYAWCRHCDDVIDGQELGHATAQQELPRGERLLALARLERDTHNALSGTADDDIFTGLGLVFERHHIDPRFPQQLLSGLRMDVEGRSYGRIEDLLEYCYCVAGTVGLMMATIMGVRTLPHLRCACDLGIAFQLTNIARDIVADQHAGRTYIPRDWLDQAGVPASAIADPVHREKLAAIAARLLATADLYYESAVNGLPALGFRSAWAVATAKVVYRSIGVEILRRGTGAWNERVSLGLARKAAGTCEGFLEAARSSTTRRRKAHPARAGLWTPGILMSEDS